MCGCLSSPSCKVFLVPLRGPHLGLKEGETWIGRGSFEASSTAQLLCSRRQALIRFSETSLRIECHGCNPLYFIICHSKGFYATQTTPASQLYQLRKGEAVHLTNGDRFYFMAMECLLTVVVTQYDTGRNSNQSSQSPLVGGTTVMVEPMAGKFKPIMDQFGGELCPNLEDKMAYQRLSERIDDSHASGQLHMSDPQTPWLKTRPFLGMRHAERPSADSSLLHSHLPGDERMGMSIVNSYSHAEKLWEVERCNPISEDHQHEAKEQVGEAMVDCDALYGLHASSPHGVHNPVSKFNQPETKEQVVELMVDGEALCDVGCASSPHEACNRIIYHQPVTEDQVEEVMADCEALGDVERASSPHGWNRIIHHHQTIAEEQVEVAMVDCEALGDVGRASYGYKQESPSCKTLVSGQGTKSGLCRIQEGDLQNSLPEMCALGAQRAGKESTPSTKDEIEPPRVASHHSEPEHEPNLAGSSSKNTDSDPVQADRGIGPISSLNDSRSGMNQTKNLREHLEEAQEVNVTIDEHDSVQCASEDLWPLGPVDGMELVIVSLTGYEGLDRSHLVKLINKTGASFTGDLTKFNTHLVCWKFRGKKFDYAMKLHMVIVNHRWFEDSLRAGRRVPEEPYKLQSGQDVGPVQWKGPSRVLVTDRTETSSKTGIKTYHPPFSDGIEDDLQNVINPQVNHMETLPNPRSAIQDEGNFGRGKEGQQLHHTRGVIAESAEAGSRHVGGRKLRNVDKSMKCPTILVREDLVGKGTSAYGSSRRTEQSHQKRVGEIGVHMSQPSPLKRLKKLRTVGEAAAINDNELERARPRHLLESTSDYNKGTNTVGCLSQEGRHQTYARIFIDLSDVDNNIQDPGLMGIQAMISERKSCETIEDAVGMRMKGRCSQSSQASQKEIACAICLTDVKCTVQGLLECGHIFCFKCIFTWIVQPVKGPNCPLCKRVCEFITKCEWDQTGALQETVVVVGKMESNTGARHSRTVVMDAVCIQCGNSDSESLLLRCETCGERACHTFCMDPPAPPPWYCPGCAHGHQRESMRLAWNHCLPGSSTGINHWSDQERRPVRRSSRTHRAPQPYGFRPPRPPSMYRPSLHREVMESMGPVHRRAIVGQDSLSTWLNRTSDVVE